MLSDDYIEASVSTKGDRLRTLSHPESAGKLFEHGTGRAPFITSFLVIGTGSISGSR